MGMWWMIDLAHRGGTATRVLDALEISPKPIHFDVIVQSVTKDVVIRTHEVLGDLLADGVVECDASGNRWRLKDASRTHK